MRYLLICITQIIVFHSLNSQAIIIPGEVKGNAYFGWSIDMDDSILVAGAYGEDDFNGALYIYKVGKKGELSIDQKILSPVPEPTKFGYSVGLSGGNIITTKGANNSGASRAAFFYEEQNGNYNFKSEHRIRIQYLGISSDIHDNDAVVGAMIGRRIVFLERDDSRENWKATDTLKPFDDHEAAYFGEEVVMGDKLALAGAYGHSDFKGAVYMFAKADTGWFQKQKMMPRDGHEYQYFGDAIDMTDSFVIVGASRDSQMGENAGAAYIYELHADTFKFKQKLTPSLLMPFDRFGRSVAIKGDYLLIGASRDDSASQDGGAAYLYKKGETGWQLVEKIAPFDFTEFSFFGSSVALSNTHLAIGGYHYSNGEYRTGAVYVRKLE